MKQTKHQRQQYVGHLEEAPPAFCEWWFPTAVDELSGASVGGHPDANRTWARKEPGRWVRRTFGISAFYAWNAQPYRQEYLAWVEAGRPEGDTPFVSLAIPVEEQGAKWKDMRATLSKIPKPIPRTHLQVRNPLRGDQEAVTQQPTNEEEESNEPIIF